MFPGSLIRISLRHSSIQVCAGERTIFKGIRNCPGIGSHSGHLERGLFPGTYWRWKFHENRNITPEEAGEEFNRLFTDSVRIRLRSDVEVELISGYRFLCGGQRCSGS